MSEDDSLENKVSECLDADTKTSIQLHSQNEVPIRQSKPVYHEGLSIPPSPPKFVTMTQLTEAAEAFYNMSLAHEITVDSEFKLEKYEYPERSLEHCVKETMHRAFWDILRSSLEATPPDYTQALNLLVDVKQSLEGLVLPNQPTSRKLIQNLLDIDVAKSQLDETGHLSLENYVGQVINLMKLFCAPIRDVEVESLRDITDPVEAFRNVFLLLEKMHMDLANFTIAQMRPYIRQQAVAYERSEFNKFVEAQQKLGFDSLVNTRSWIRNAYDTLNQSDVDKSVPNTNSADPINETIPVTPNNILREAYLSLLDWPKDVEWPETMMMDRQRVIDLGNQLTLIVNLTSLVLVVCNYVASHMLVNMSAKPTIGSSSMTTTPPTTSPSSIGVNKGVNLFSLPLPSNPPTDAMIKLKQAVGQDSAGILHAISLNYKTEQIVEALTEQLVLTLELWYKHCLNSTVLEQSTTDEAPSLLAYVTDQGKTGLTNQISLVVRGEHVVYKLMYKRALGFLRTALSSYPPEPLPLPPGFSILLDINKSTPQNNVQHNLELCNSSPGISVLQTRTANSSNVPVTMQSGRAGVTSAATTNSYLHKPQLAAVDENSLERGKSNGEILTLSGLAGRLMPLLAHNRHVFGPYYAEIIQSLLRVTVDSDSPNNNDSTNLS